MFCSKCGNELSDGDIFCSKCGTKIGANCQRTTHLICQHCGSVMDYDDERQIVACSYCGSKELVGESDSVKIERIKSKTILSREKQSNDFELEMEHYAEELRRRKNRESWIVIGVSYTIIFMFIAIVIIVVRFTS